MLPIFLSTKNQKTTDLTKDKLIKDKNIYLIIKRFGGNKPVGHAHKIINYLHNNKNISENLSSNIDLNTYLPKDVTNSRMPKKVVEIPFDQMVFSETSKDTSAIKSYNSASTNETQEIINQSMKVKLVTYEDIATTTKENNKLNYPESGAIKLTPTGLKFYQQARPEITTSDKQHPIDFSKVTFDVILLNINEKTEVLLPRQTHLVVVHDHTTHTCKAIGILTSHKSPNNIKLSDTQPISNNESKDQLFRPFDKHMIVDTNDIIFHKEGTEYIQDPQVHKILLEYLQKTPINKEITKYNNIGVTKDDLKKMMEIQQKLPITTDNKPKASNFLTEEQTKKTLLRLEKMEKNQIKQKKLAEEQKKLVAEKNKHTITDEKFDT